MSKLVQFDLDNGEKIFLENVSNSKGGSFQQAGVGDMITKAPETFEKTIQKIRPAAIAIAETFRSMAPDELEIEFGLKLTAEANVIITSVETEMNFTVKMTWKK